MFIFVPISNLRKYSVILSILSPINAKISIEIRVNLDNICKYRFNCHL